MSTPGPRRADLVIRLCALVFVLAPGVAVAQAPGPFGGLFGRTPERVGREFTALDFRTAIGAQYDDEVLGDDEGPLGTRPRSGSTAGVNAGITFERSTDRVLLDLRSAATYQEYYRQPRFGATSVDAGGQFSGKVATRLTIDAGGNYLHSPFYHLQPTLAAPSPASEIAVPGDPFIARTLENDTYDVMVGFTSPYSKRSTLSAAISRRETRFASQPRNNFAVNGARAQWTRRLNRDFSLRAGYGREQIRQRDTAGSEFVHEVIDLGVDFLRQISVARRTAMAFNAQTSVIRETGGERRYRLNGGVSLTRHFQRTWQASISANRTTEFLPGFFNPLFSDAVSGSVAGMISKRAEWFATVSGGRGQFGFEDTGDFLTANATTRANFALTRHLGVYAQYSLYYYDLPPQSSAIILFQELGRQAITVGLTAWVPVINRVRAPRDPQ